MFTKEDFNILLDHNKWDYIIKLVPEAESKIFKVYFLFLIK